MSKCPFRAFFQNEKGGIFFSTSKQEDIQSLTISNEVKKFHSELKNSKESNLTHFIQLSEADIQRLVNSRAIFEEHIHEIVDTFYEQISKTSILMDIINFHSNIETLKLTLQRYILDMVSGEIGAEYIARRHKVGEVHNRINLFPQWYIGAFALIQNAVFRILIKYSPSIDIAEQTFQSFMKLCSFDMQIAIRTYISSYTSTMMKLSEIEELQQRLTQSSFSLVKSAEETTTAIANKKNDMQKITSEIDDILTSSQKMKHQVLDGKKDIGLSLLEVERIINTIEKTNKVTYELMESSNSISDVVEVIRKISTQTNMLSLNASIEAVRAGEHGKGFRIVAEEVRNLSLKTKELVESIQEQIESVQNKVSMFANFFANIVKQTEFLKKSNTNVIQVLEQTVTNVNMSDEQTKRLHEAIVNFNETFSEITKASLTIANMAEELNYLNDQLNHKF